MDKQNEIASILTYGEIHGDRKAAAHFGISLRTIQRYRKQLKEGDNPEMARVVAEVSQHVATKHRDLMDEVFELSLQSLKVRVVSALANKSPIKDRSLIEAIRILSEQRVTRDFLLEDEDNDELGSVDLESATEAEGAIKQAPSCPTSDLTAVH